MASSPPSESPPGLHVWLVLVEDKEICPGFYLEVPTVDAERLCKNPVKYLHYLSFTILNVDGSIAREDGTSVGGTDPLVNGSIYYYWASGEEMYPVNVELAKKKTESATSNFSQRDPEFEPALVERDQACIFTPAPLECSDAMHIVPFAKGESWLAKIIDSRKNNVFPEEDIPASRIDDPANGCLGNMILHKCIDRRDAAILKVYLFLSAYPYIINGIQTPNRILNMEDIPRTERTVPLPEGCHPPVDERFTFQWLRPSDGSPFTNFNAPDNADAAFNASSTASKPSGLLLHYIYAATAVMVWGQNAEILAEQPGVVSPPASLPRPSQRPPIGAVDEGGIVDGTGFAFDPLDISFIASMCHPAAVKARARHQEEFSASVTGLRV